jgi:hypothetical protein
MFKKLFGASQPKVDTASQKIMESKRNQFEIKKARNEIEIKIEENHNKIEAIEGRIRDRTKVS